MKNRQHKNWHWSSGRLAEEVRLVGFFRQWRLECASSIALAPGAPVPACGFRRPRTSFVAGGLQAFGKFVTSGGKLSLNWAVVRTGGSVAPFLHTVRARRTLLR